MGRITLFTSNNCLFSLKVKHELTLRQLPYTEINLSDHPGKRSDMFVLTRCMTTPRAFFNTRYVGGIDDTLKLLKEWDKDRHFKSPLEKYKAHIQKFPDPTNPHLDLPEGPQDLEETSCSESSVVPLLKEPPTVELELPNGTSKTYGISELTEELSQVLPLSNLSFHFTTFKKSVTGAQAVTALMKHFQTETREEAEAIGKQLHQLNMIHHVCHDHDFQDTSKFYYRLQAHQQPNVLNSLYLLEEEKYNEILSWNVAQAEALIERLEDIVWRLERECYTLEKEGGIRYSEGAKTTAFRELEEGICLLQAIELDDMTAQELLAFGLNVYNIMLKFAFFKLGIPQKEDTQRAFIRDTQFIIGGNLFSFSQWLGVISPGKDGDGKARSESPTPKEKRSSRSSRFSLTSLESSNPKDCRVYFAVYAFWARATAIPHFTAQNLDKELNIMAMAFCAEDNNVKVDTKRGDVLLSKVFSWYQKEFSNWTSDIAPEISGSLSSKNPADKHLTNLVFNFVEAPKKLQLQQLLYSGSKTKMKITFRGDDDWTINAFQKDYVVFNPSSVDANTTRF